MPKRKVQLTSVEAGKRLNSHVKVYDAKTGQLKRIENQAGDVLWEKLS